MHACLDFYPPHSIRPNSFIRLIYLDHFAAFYKIAVYQPKLFQWISNNSHVEFIFFFLVWFFGFRIILPYAWYRNFVHRFNLTVFSWHHSYYRFNVIPRVNLTPSRTYTIHLYQCLQQHSLFLPHFFFQNRRYHFGVENAFFEHKKVYFTTIKSDFHNNNGILLAANPKLPFTIAIKDFLYLMVPQCHKPCNHHEM